MILIALLVIALLAIAAVRTFGGWAASVTLMEYQQAVLFRRGLPVRTFGPGHYRVFTGFEKMFILDTRPVQVSYENQAVSLRDGFAATYSLLGTARIRDARKALYAAGNYNDVPPFVLLCCTRSVLNGCTREEVKSEKDRVADRIIARAEPRLDAAGFELTTFRLTQCSVGGYAAQNAE